MRDWSGISVLNVVTEEFDIELQSMGGCSSTNIGTLESMYRICFPLQFLKAIPATVACRQKYIAILT